MATPAILVPPTKMMVKTVEDFQHPALEQLPHLAFCINDNPGWGTAIILGFQHYLTMLGTTVLIPTLVFRSIGGHSVGPSFGARNKEREGESFARASFDTSFLGILLLELSHRLSVPCGFWW
jgi:hypothetical protein